MRFALLFIANFLPVITGTTIATEDNTLNPWITPLDTSDTVPLAENLDLNTNVLLSTYDASNNGVGLPDFPNVESMDTTPDAIAADDMSMHHSPCPFSLTTRDEQEDTPSSGLCTLPKDNTSPEGSTKPPSAGDRQPIKLPNIYDGIIREWNKVPFLPPKLGPKPKCPERKWVACCKTTPGLFPYLGRPATEPRAKDCEWWPNRKCFNIYVYCCLAIYDYYDPQTKTDEHLGIDCIPLGP